MISVTTTQLCQKQSQVTGKGTSISVFQYTYTGKKKKKKNTREWAIKPMNSQELVTTENIFKYPLIWACEMFPVRWRDKLLLCEHLWILDTIVHLRRLLWLIYQITFRAAYSVWSPQQETLLQQVHTDMQAARPIEPFFPVDARCVCSRNRYWWSSGQVL